MNSGQYDKDCATWDPQGDIKQIKYAMDACTKMGAAVLGLKSKTHAVLVCFKNQAGQAEFVCFDKKLFKVDEHCGVGISGITADARVLTEYMRSECLTHKFVFDAPMPIGRLVSQIGDKSIVLTFTSNKRPYGVGLLAASYESTGPHIYQTLPSGDYYEFKAIAMGNRSESAKTYLEKHCEKFLPLNLPDLIRHGVKALSITTEQLVELTTSNMDVAVVGEDCDFHILPAEEVQKYIDELKSSEPAPQPMEIA